MNVSRYVEASLCHPALPHDLWKVKDGEGLLALLSAIIICAAAAEEEFVKGI